MEWPYRSSRAQPDLHRVMGLSTANKEVSQLRRRLGSGACRKTPRRESVCRVKRRKERA